MNQISPITRARAGRPTKEQAEARHAELLDRAIDHFLDSGFERATIEAIAADVNMTKRTVYARYPGKEDLFMASLRRCIEANAVTREVIENTRAGNLEATLINLAMLRIGILSEPRSLKLQRLIETESFRFPDIFGMAYELHSRPTVQFLEDLLNEEAAAGRLAISDTGMAAIVFMSMVISGPVRFITSGNPLPKKQLDERVGFAVHLFLEGARPR